MFQVFDAPSAADVWKQIAAALVATSETQSSRAGATREILHAAITIRNPRSRWVSTRVPPISPAYALAELLWVLSGRNDAAFLNYFNPSLPKFAGAAKQYHGAYGFRMRQSRGFDQLARAYHALRAKPDSRQVVLQIWDSACDLPGDDGSESSQDVPCSIVSLLKVRDGALEWTQVVRSNDVFLGVPYDFALFTSLQEIMAGWLGVAVGTYNHLSDSLHVYERDLAHIRSYADGPPLGEGDRFELSFDVCEAGVREVTRVVDGMVSGAIGVREVSVLDQELNLSREFANILRVLVAYACRRAGERELCSRVMERCTNGVYRSLWSQWDGRA